MLVWAIEGGHPMHTQTAAIDAAVREYVDTSGVTGLAIAVTQRGQIVFCAGYGVQNRDTMQPVTPATLFHLASVVKTMTSTAIMQLREAGKLDLDDPIVARLPYFRVADPRSDQITIRQCLSHTSGIAHPEDWGWDRPEFDEGALERHIRGLADHALTAIPPGKTSYSDDAYNVLGALIAHVSGMSYEAYMQRHIFEPLGMAKTTTMAPREGDPALLAMGYERDEAGAIRRSLYPYNRIHVPCGCVASSVLEMARYTLAHLNRGELDGVRILAPESYDAMWAVQVPAPGRRAESALGWWVRRGAAELIVEHDGEDDGFLSHMCLWPERQQSIVVLCSASWSEPERVTHIVSQLLNG
jgi:CubicO group peptidase (beta-lactamase class C family)